MRVRAGQELPAFAPPHPRPRSDKSLLVEGAGFYYEALVGYIHLNPARAGLVKAARGTGILAYPWSSVAGGYALPPGRRAKWLAATAGLEAMGFADTTAGRRRYVARLDRIIVEEGAKHAGIPSIEDGVDARRSHLRRG